MPAREQSDPPLSRPLIIAHRGASATHPENTLGAFEAAAAAGADLVEFDARLTADGVPVVLHDGDLGRTTDRTGLVHELTLEEVRAADASGERGTREGVPTLQEVLELLAPTGVGVDVEIKNLPGEPAFDSQRESILRATLDVLDRVAFPGPVLITSFNPSTVRRSRELAPHRPTGVLTFASGDLDAAMRVAEQAGHRWLLPHAVSLRHAGEAAVPEAHALGLLVGAWTVDDPEAIRSLLGWGVDAVATNDPATGVAVRDAMAGLDQA